MKRLFQTAPFIMSKNVIALLAIGKGKSLVRAIHNERRSENHEGHSGDGITVKRVGSYQVK